jgi:hypothetical protein
MDCRHLVAMDGKIALNKTRKGAEDIVALADRFIFCPLLPSFFSSGYPDFLGFFLSLGTF